MFKTGYHVKQQKIWAGDSKGYTYYEIVYWAQWRITILGIPVYVENIKGFGSVCSALKYIHERSLL